MAKTPSPPPPPFLSPFLHSLCTCIIIIIVLFLLYRHFYPTSATPSS